MACDTCQTLILPHKNVLSALDPWTTTTLFAYLVIGQHALATAQPQLAAPSVPHAQKCLVTSSTTNAYKAGFRNITLALHVATRSQLTPVVASVTTLGSSAVNQEV
jgi:hypothetical protein